PSGWAPAGSPSPTGAAVVEVTARVVVVASAVVDSATAVVAAAATVVGVAVVGTGAALTATVGAGPPVVAGAGGAGAWVVVSATISEAPATAPPENSMICGSAASMARSVAVTE